MIPPLQSHTAGDVVRTPAIDMSERPSVFHEPSSGPALLPSVREEQCGEVAAPVVATSEVPAPAAKPAITLERLKEGARKLALTRRAQQMMEDDATLSQKAVAKRLRVSETMLCKCLALLRAKPEATAEDFAPGVSSGRKPEHRFTKQEAAVVTAFNAKTNRTATAGSATHAIRAAIRSGAIRPDLAEELTKREAEGKSILTPHLHDQVRVGALEIQAIRRPRNTWLENVSNHGSQQLIIDPKTGLERLYRPGEAWTIDDATINMPCWLELERRGDPCFDRFRCMVGRFQFLLVVDHSTYYIPGFSYTARPRGSYRAEDLTATLHNTIRQWGAPRQLIMERGISAANLVHDTFHQAGVEVIHATSPHQKIVEMVFNQLWTILSLHRGQVGRYQGEEEKTARVLAACQAGHKDPREHFLSLPELLAALREAIAIWNSHRVTSDNYGEWIPEELWAREAGASLTRFAPQDAWIFSPVIAGPLKVHGGAVSHRVQLMEGLSTKFNFASELLLPFHKATVRIHFNPFSQDTTGMAVLAEDFAGTRAGTRIGVVDQINRMTRRHRRLLGYGLDLDIGREVVSRIGQQIRRNAESVLPKGGVGVVTTTVRDTFGAEGAGARPPELDERNPIDVHEVMPVRALPVPANRAEEDPELRAMLEDEG